MFHYLRRFDFLIGLVQLLSLSFIIEFGLGFSLVIRYAAFFARVITITFITFFINALISLYSDFIMIPNAA